MVKIGKLQLLRKLVVRQIYFAAKVENSQYTQCLEAVNESVLHNIMDIKETAKMEFLQRLQPDIAAMVLREKMFEQNNPDEKEEGSCLTKE